jgi:tripeptide aminopeptidase
MIDSYQHTVTERFLRYVQIDTQSDPSSDSSPSTAKQKNLSQLLYQELLAMGLLDVYTDDYGYVYATIPANTDKQVPVICFCSHVDTAPDCSGTGVKPILHNHYLGGDIVLPDDPSQVIRLADYPYLQQHIGKAIITASGATLLGADDKSGVAIIMDMAHYLVRHPEIPHGTIRLLFTPDEEVGRGTDKVDLGRLGAAVAYTLDGGACGTLEDETFSADGVSITIEGVSAHPGYAKGKLVNALKIAGDILAALPRTTLSPETTSGRQGFIHPVQVQGIAEKTVLEFIIRDFETSRLAAHETTLRGIVDQVMAGYPGATYQFTVKEQYRNMREVLDQHPNIIAHAMTAYEQCGLTVVKEPIRGGTDGSRLSFMGLPCANIFTGMQAIHSKHEWIGVSDMEKAVEVLVKLVQVWEAATEG